MHTNSDGVVRREEDTNHGRGRQADGRGKREKEGPNLQRDDWQWTQRRSVREGEGERTERGGGTLLGSHTY